jgi:hypothetical protein
VQKSGQLLALCFSSQHRFDLTNSNLKDLPLSWGSSIHVNVRLDGVLMRYHVSVVAKFFIQIVVAVPVFLLWYAVITLIGRAFGVRLPFRGLRQHNGTSQSLTFLQQMWWKGVLGWGYGMWIITTSYDYLDWKYWSGSAHNLSAGYLLSRAALLPLGGLLFGWMTWNARTDTAES